MRRYIEAIYCYAMLDLALLGVLDEGPQHGYELRKRLRSQFGLVANVSFGSIYPALSRLESNGAVETIEAPPALTIAPPTGSLSGERAATRARRRSSSRGRRSRKVYRITSAGRQFFLARLTDPAADDARSFSLRLSLARHMEPADRLALMERRRAQLIQQRPEVPSAHNAQLDDYARSVAEHIAEGVEQDIAWLDRLIESERDNGASGEPDRRTTRRTA
ncbi:MAG TPA: PadR family transcriptional regulator [Acidimicrobiales bacterium]|nr:PadR family transcriptional regulator [Acidimicrobiales bacterium]